MHKVLELMMSKWRWLLTTICAGCSGLLLAAEPDWQAQLRAQADRWDKAIVARQATEIEANMSEDFRQIDSAGGTRDGQAFLVAILDPKLQIDPYTVEDFDIRRYGDVALLSGRTQMTGHYDGAAFSSHYRYIDVYALQDGQWRVVSVQITPVRE